MAEHTVQSHRICGKQQHSHVYRITGAGTISFHCCDPVHNVQSRPHTLVQIYQHSGKDVYKRQQTYHSEKL